MIQFSPVFSVIAEEIEAIDISNHLHNSYATNYFPGITFSLGIKMEKQLLDIVTTKNIPGQILVYLKT